MNLENIVVFDTAFKTSFGKLLRLELPASTALKLVKTVKEIDEHTKDILKVRDGLLDRYCTKDDTGKLVTTDNGAPKFTDQSAAQVFSDEMNNILKETFPVPLDRKIKLPENIAISVEDILNLEAIIEI